MAPPTECCIRAYRHGQQLSCAPCHPMYWYDWLAVGLVGLAVLYGVYCFVRLLQEFGKGP